MMRKKQTILMALGMAFLAMPLLVHADAQQQSSRRQHVTDSVIVRGMTPTWNEIKIRNGATSPYPIQLSVKGNSLMIRSKKKQILPIFTDRGALYLTCQLRPGTNWVTGLPRGRYRINNRNIQIN
ncbi:MAG: hypothetical protein SPF56_09665 [Bacteroidaceae bacterium]|nr:hypothetical protein [Bacteroidaceae bacterium]